MGSDCNKINLAKNSKEYKDTDLGAIPGSEGTLQIGLLLNSMRKLFMGSEYHS